MKKLIYSLAAAVSMILAFSCTEGSSIGNSLVEESVAITVDSSFTVVGKTVKIDSVQSRTLSQLIGNIDARGFGSIYSDFVGQFMPSLTLDTVDIASEQVDSVKLFIQMRRGAYVGDSLAPMGLTVYPLTKDLPYPIYSNYNPQAEGCYNAGDILCQGTYVASSINEPDSVKKLSVIYKALPIDKSFGVKLLDAYRANPGAFSNPVTFAKDVFKGIYIRSSYGSGRISDFSSTSIRFYYHKSVYNTDSARYDTTNYVGDYFAVTPEVVVNNNIKYTPAAEITSMVNAGRHLVVAPVGYEVEIEFPAQELLDSYNRAAGFQRVLNTLTFNIPVEKIENDFNIAPPPYVLMILKNKKEEFFATNSLTDGITSFYAAYDSAKNCYTFNAMRDYLLKLLEKDNLSSDDYTFVITPVQVNLESTGNSYYGTSTVESSIVPYVSTPAMAELLLNEAKIKLTFSSNNAKNL